MTLSDISKVVMYDKIDKSLWYKKCDKVFEIESIRQKEVKDILLNLNLDLMIMCGWRQVIDMEILSIPRLGTIGFHPTPLPKGRGPAPIINSILEGWKESAVTLFYPSDGLDDGDIIDQECFDIGSQFYAIDVYDCCVRASRKLIKRNIKNILSEDVKRIKQDESKATYLNKITLKDNKIEVDGCPEEAYRKIRAFSYPYLGAFIEIGNKKIIIDEARICTKIKKF
jgi:methionyl-tRNA formyltransferase